MRSLYLTLIYLSFFVTGVAAPFALTLGYLWVDTFRPQDVSYAILNALPVSMLVGAAAVGSYVLLDRRAPPRPNAVMVLTLVLAAWVTMTTIFLAVAPEAAWRKWDWAFKTLVFSVFVQFTIRSRVQIEAFLQIYLLAIAANFVPVGIKTLLTGGGYGQSLGLSGGDSMIGESSTLAAVALMSVPTMLYLRKHTLLLPERWLREWLYIGLVVLAVVAAIGTYARTGLIAMIVVGAGTWLQTRHKVLFALVAAAAVVAIVTLTSDSWNARISTIDDYQNETSALGRILVWQWTLGFVVDHPFGGGFESYLVNTVTLPNGSVTYGKAFHNVYFEVLGEHGWLGLTLFCGLCLASLLAQQKVIRATRRDPDRLWCLDLAKSLRLSLVTLMCCGSFIGIAFLPMFYYLFAISAVLQGFLLRSGASRGVAGRRAMADGAWRPLRSRPT